MKPFSSSATQAQGRSCASCAEDAVRIENFLQPEMQRVQRGCQLLKSRRDLERWSAKASDVTAHGDDAFAHVLRYFAARPPQRAAPFDELRSTDLQLRRRRDRYAQQRARIGKERVCVIAQRGPEKTVALDRFAAEPRVCGLDCSLGA